MKSSVNQIGQPNSGSYTPWTKNCFHLTVWVYKVKMHIVYDFILGNLVRKVYVSSCGLNSVFKNDPGFRKGITLKWIRKHFFNLKTLTHLLKVHKDLLPVTLSWQNYYFLPGGWGGWPNIRHNCEKPFPLNQHCKRCYQIKVFASTESNHVSVKFFTCKT